MLVNFDFQFILDKIHHTMISMKADFYMLPQIKTVETISFTVALSHTVYRVHMEPGRWSAFTGTQNNKMVLKFTLSAYDCHLCATMLVHLPRNTLFSMLSWSDLGRTPSGSILIVSLVHSHDTHLCVMPLCVLPVCVMPLCIMPPCVMPACVMPLCVMPLCVMPLCVTPLRFASLCDACLRYASLRHASLCDAPLRYASLRYACLRFASFCDACLHDAF